MFKKAVLIIIALVILAGVGFLSYQRFLNPQRVFEKMIDNMTQLESANLQLEVRIISGDNTQGMSESVVYPEEQDQLSESMKMLIDQVVQLPDIKDKVEITGRGAPVVIDGQIMTVLTMVPEPELLSDFSNIVGVLWVGKKDHLLHRASFVSLMQEGENEIGFEIDLILSDL